MTDISINGDNLRAILHQYGVKQIQLAKQVGVTKYTVSRWCSSGVQNIRRNHIERIANVLGISFEALLEKAAKNFTPPSFTTLNDMEEDWLSVWRSVPPNRRHILRAELEKIVEELDD